MFVGREKELALLNQSYQAKENTMIILYGREGIGKTALIRRFIEDKTYVYYQARELSQTEQIMYFEEKQKEVLLKAEQERVIFIVDEFDLMQKGYKTFLQDFAEYVQKLPAGRCMILLASSSIQWVENTMVEDMGDLSNRITSFIKLKEFSFMEMVDRFPDSTTEQCVLIYAIFGGVPAYLDHWNPREALKKNMVRIILDHKGSLHREAQRFLKTSLRELPYYSTILSVLAEGKPKLNYLHTRTGFSRAKISVYIKNLMQIDVAAKIFSYEPEKKDIVQKGLYGITDSFLYFWYKLIYPHMSELSLMEPDKFYDTFLKNKMDELVERTYEKVCHEFLELMNQFDRLPGKFGKFESLYGKEGVVPLIADSQEGELLVGTCQWDSKPMGIGDFEAFLSKVEQTGREADFYYFFSKEGFTSELSAMAKNMTNIHLIDLEKM